MAIKKESTSKKPTYAVANASGGGSSSVPMVEMHPHGPGAANHIQPPPPLPPGVYFGPTREELPARAMVSQEYFDAIAKRLPEGSVRGVERAAEMVSEQPAETVKGRTELRIFA
jgi:hypothetical protein